MGFYVEGVQRRPLAEMRRRAANPRMGRKRKGIEVGD